MTDPVVSAPPTGAAPVAAPPVPPTAAAPPPAATPTEPKVGDPDWLKPRIERAAEAGKKEARRELKAERRALKDAGVAAKAAVDAAAADVAAAKLAVDAILKDVPAEQRAFIEKSGAGNTAKTLEAFAMWRQASTLVAAPPPATPAAPATEAVPPVAAPKTVAAPATSAPAAAAPAAPSGAQAGEDHAAVYRDLKSSSPYEAADYLLAHSREIFTDKNFVKK